MTESEIAEAVDVASESHEKIIETKDLTMDFGGIPVVQGVTFYVPRGTIFGFIGPSGSGKTTTIRMLTGSKSLRNVEQHRSRPHGPMPPCTLASSRAESCRSSTRQARVRPKSRTSARKSTRWSALK